MQDAAQGSFAIGWDQVTVDGIAGPDLTHCRAGQSWRWSGRAIRLDGPADILRLAEPVVAADLRRHARRAAGRLVPLRQRPADEDYATGGPMLVVTDGRHAWPVSIVQRGPGHRAIAHFPEALPPQGTDLWITRADLPFQRARLVEAWQGLAAGTPVATPAGDIAVERIEPGMCVLTPDGAAVTVTSRRARHVSGARLCVTPALTPVRIAAHAFGPGLPWCDVLLAPDQDIAVDSSAVRALFPVAPVTLAARDAAGLGAIGRAEGLPGMTAHELKLSRLVPVLAAGLVLPMGDEAPLRRLSRGEVAILLSRSGPTPAARPLARFAQRC